MSGINWKLIQEAARLVVGGIKRVDVSDKVLVYRVGAMVRVDIKGAVEKKEETDGF